jgi:hypothetical protein
MHLKNSQKQTREAVISDNVSIKDDFVYVGKEAKGVPGGVPGLLIRMKRRVGLGFEGK